MLLLKKFFHFSSKTIFDIAADFAMAGFEYTRIEVLIG